MRYPPAIGLMQIMISPFLSRTLNFAGFPLIKNKIESVLPKPIFFITLPNRILSGTSKLSPTSGIIIFYPGKGIQPAKKFYGDSYFWGGAKQERGQIDQSDPFSQLMVFYGHLINPVR